MISLSRYQLSWVLKFTQDTVRERRFIGGRENTKLERPKDEKCHGIFRKV